MEFHSSLFLTLFLPLFLALYFLADKKYKNKILLIASIIFYSWGEPKFIFVLLFTTVLDFYLVKKIHSGTNSKQRILYLILSVSVNLSLLFYYKYCGFFVENINVALKSIGITQIGWTSLVLPIGISFYTFETITYVVDVYRRVHKPLDDFFDYLLYILMFPKLVAGPIIRYHEIADQISDRSSNDTIDYKLSGFYRFCIGLAKKVLIANALSQYYVDGIMHLNTDELSTASAWLGLLGFTFQIYFDFSGYCDIAIGLGKMMGFKFPENFDSPYLSTSISEFWRRWHITLGKWMKNYLYIPLGGNRVSTSRIYFNLWLVFLLSGLWHKGSWNFVIWGAYHGLFIIADKLFLDKLTQKLNRLVKIGYTFFFTCIGWLIFATEDLSHLKKYFGVLFGLSHTKQFIVPQVEFWIPFFVAIIFSFICYFEFGKKLQNTLYFGNMTNGSHMTWVLVAILLFVISLSFITTSGFSPFIYYRF